MTNPDREELVKLEAERAELIAKNEAATSWGAAVGARSERIKGLDGRIAALRRLASSDGGTEPARWEWSCFEDNEQRTGWQCEGHGDQKGWEKLVENNPAKYRIVRRPLFTVPPADAGMREALERIQSAYDELCVRFSGVHSDDAMDSVLLRLHAALTALTAPGATTKSDGGVSLNDVREALERSIRELEYNRANHYSPDITTINRLKSQVLQAITKSDGGGESRPANPGTGGRAPCIEQTTPATMPAQAGVAPGPSDPSSTRSDPNEQAYADLIASGGIFPEAYQQGEASMTDDQIKHMVDRFLGWKLPEDFSPDCGISFDQSYRSEHGPVGTNLFDAVQATAMVRHMLDGLPSSTRSEVTVESLEHELREAWDSVLPELRGFDAQARALLDQFEIRRK